MNNPTLPDFPVDDAAPLRSAPAAGVAPMRRAEFAEAIAPLMPRLYRFCLALCRDRAEADDVLQDGLVRAFLRVGTFERQSDLFGWLCGVLRNQFIEQRRSAARRRTLLESVVETCSPVLEELFGGGQGGPSPEDVASLGQDTAMLLSALRRLPEDFRTVVLLHDIEGLGYEEIAAITALPVGTVKSRHARGRARLIEAFERIGGRDGDGEGEEGKR